MYVIIIGWILPEQMTTFPSATWRDVFEDGRAKRADAASTLCIDRPFHLPLYVAKLLLCKILQ